MFTPVDIENKEFKKSMRGYDVSEVEEFLRALVLDYEKLYRENATHKERNAMLQDTISSYKGMEETMQNAIIVAQKTAEDIKKNAYERADNIVKEAQIRASEAISNADKSIAELDKRYMALKGEADTFRARMRSMLTTYMQLLDDLEPDIRSAAPHHCDVSFDSFDTKDMPVVTSDPPKERTLETDAPHNPAGGVNPVIDELLSQSKQPSSAPSEGVKQEIKTDLADFNIRKQTFDNTHQQGSFANGETKEILLNITSEDSKEDYFDVFKDRSL